MIPELQVACSVPEAGQAFRVFNTGFVQIMEIMKSHETEGLHLIVDDGKSWKIKVMLNRLDILQMSKQGKCKIETIN